MKSQPSNGSLIRAGLAVGLEERISIFAYMLWMAVLAIALMGPERRSRIRPPQRPTLRQQHPSATCRAANWRTCDVGDWLADAISSSDTSPRLGLRSRFHGNHASGQR